jgi:hypothetical protein
MTSSLWPHHCMWSFKETQNHGRYCFNAILCFFRVMCYVVRDFINTLQVQFSGLPKCITSCRFSIDLRQVSCHFGDRPCGGVERVCKEHDIENLDVNFVYLGDGLMARYHWDGIFGNQFDLPRRSWYAGSLNPFNVVDNNVVAVLL